MVSMRIDFRSTGGFVPLDLHYSADTEQLPGNLAAELTDLVAQADLWGAVAHEAHATAPDASSYRLRVQDGSRVRELAVDDASAPASVRPLLARLRRLALEQRRAARDR
jgi:Emfourin